MYMILLIMILFLTYRWGYRRGQCDALKGYQHYEENYYNGGFKRK